MTKILPLLLLFIFSGVSNARTLSRIATPRVINLADGDVQKSGFRVEWQGESKDGLKALAIFCPDEMNGQEFQATEVGLLSGSKLVTRYFISPVSSTVNGKREAVIYINRESVTNLEYSIFYGKNGQQNYAYKFTLPASSI